MKDKQVKAKENNQGFFSRLDILGNEIGLKYGSDDKFKTGLGGIVSIIVMGK